MAVSKLPEVPAFSHTVKLPVRSCARANQRMVAAFDRYLTARNYATNTRKFYRQILRKFVKFIGAESVLHVELVTVRRFLVRHYADGGSADSLHRCRGVLRAFYRFLSVAGVIHSSPAQFVEVPKPFHKLPRCLSESEVGRLLAAGIGLRDRAILELLYASGLRLSEIADLQLEEINLDAGTLMVRAGKGNKDGLAFFGMPATEALRAYICDRTRGPVFLNSSGGPLRKRSIRLIVGASARRAGLADVHPHTLRHSFATHLLNHGADIRYVQQLLRHARLSTTQIYTHTAIADLARVHARCHPKGDSHVET
jgi:site-specific recombinase XerD